MPAPRMIRCINGHVFDAQVQEACPICGWMDTASAVDSGRSVDSSPVPPRPDRRLVLIAASGLVVAAGAGTYALLRKTTPDPLPDPVPEPIRRTETAVVRPEPPGPITPKEELPSEVATKPETPPDSAPRGAPILTDLPPLQPDEQIAAARSLGLSSFATETALLTRALRLSERQPALLDPKRLLVPFVRAGQPLALTEAATASYFGYAVPINDPAALDFVTRAADQGSVRGRSLFAQMLLAGRAVPRDPIAAGDLLVLVAKADSANLSQATFGLTALKRSVEGTGPTSADLGRAVAQGNWELAVRLARALADLKIASGYSILGERSFAGVGLERNVPAAISFFEKAVAIGYANAAYNLSVVAATPPNGSANLPENMVWLQIAVLQAEDKRRAVFFTDRISAQAGLLDRRQSQAIKTLFAGIDLPGLR